VEGEKISDGNIHTYVVIWATSKQLNTDNLKYDIIWLPHSSGGGGVSLN